jgi:hypothetical protein
MARISELLQFGGTEAAHGAYYTKRHSLISRGNSLLSPENFPVQMRGEFGRNYLTCGAKNRACP